MLMLSYIPDIQWIQFSSQKAGEINTDCIAVAVKHALLAVKGSYLVLGVTKCT